MGSSRCLLVRGQVANRGLRDLRPASLRPAPLSAALRRCWRQSQPRLGSSPPRLKSRVCLESRYDPVGVLRRRPDAEAPPCAAMRLTHRFSEEGRAARPSPASPTSWPARRPGNPPPIWAPDAAPSGGPGRYWSDCFPFPWAAGIRAKNSRPAAPNRPDRPQNSGTRSRLRSGE